MYPFPYVEQFCSRNLSLEVDLCDHLGIPRTICLTSDLPESAWIGDIGIGTTEYNPVEYVKRLKSQF